MSILQYCRNWLFSSYWWTLQNDGYSLQNGENKILVMGKMCENWEKKHFRFCFLGEVGGIFQDRHQLPIQNISEMTQWIIPEMGVPIFSDFFFQAIYSPPLTGAIESKQMTRDRRVHTACPYPALINVALRLLHQSSTSYIPN